MISDPSITKNSIRTHYDLATPFYRLLWGQHIHHGLWENADATPEEAQRRLIDRLAAVARVGKGQRVLDVGCGMGGSSMKLAQRFGCKVTGLTLSPVQRSWATLSAGFQGLGDRVNFRCADAEKVKLPTRTFDVVWNVECSEHLFDKPAFFRRVAGWLKPGGRVALAPGSPATGRITSGKCWQFASTSSAHRSAPPTTISVGFAPRGMIGGVWHDITGQVEQTWDICMDRIRRSGVSRIGWLVGQDMQRFLDHFTTLREAYRSRAMRYGLFTAEMPA